MKSIKEIDLSPKQGKKYWDCPREWREEFIYFLLIDRFHDNNKRDTIQFETRHTGFGTDDQLDKICGGNLRGIINNIGYIKNIGCTAIWLSPVLKNNPESYHGYAIENYLEVDERFGTKDDLEELVNVAHQNEMRVFLDIVLHHAGNIWNYPEGKAYNYQGGTEFPFGNWRYEDKPVPLELRDTSLYGRHGQIQNFDSFPETIEGDFFTLKAFKNNVSEQSDYVQKILTEIHCYWIRELDIDGFRFDAVKHMGATAINRFCSAVREYVYSLGKKNFFLFGEIVAGDAFSNNYLGPKSVDNLNDLNIYSGLNSALDFQLYFLLDGVIKGKDSPGKLIERYTDLQKNALHRGDNGQFLVTFIDNHDQVGLDPKHRFGHNAESKQIIAGIAFLLCAAGVPCMYYGTEQGLDGNGNGDKFIRECLFNLDDKNTNILNQQSEIYKGIAVIAQLRKDSKVLKFGRMYMREMSPDGIHFHFPNSNKCTLVFSRILYNQEMVFVYNSSNNETKEEFILIDNRLHRERKWMTCIYGNKEKVEIIHSEGSDKPVTSIKLNLAPMELVIFQSA